MNHAVIHHYEKPVTVANVREVRTEDVWRWLAAGWRDIRNAPGQSLFYGVALALASFLLVGAVVASDMYFLLPQLLAAFFLVAPVLGIGLYYISQQLEEGKKPSFTKSLVAFRQNSFNLLNMGLVLFVALVAWVTLAQLIVALTFTGITPATWQGFVSSLFGTWEGLQLMAVGIFSGAIIAFLVFGISAISVPMLMDRECNVFDAIQTSWTAVRHNLIPMLLWAAVLLGIIYIGFATLFVGLIIGFPLAAHATWHAYRDLVEPE